MKVKSINKENHMVKFANRRQAIHNKCIDCSGGIPKEVKNCTHKLCPLYCFRILRSKQNSSGRERAIRKYCFSCMNGQSGEIMKCPSHECPLFIFRKGGIDKHPNVPSIEEKSDIGGVSARILGEGVKVDRGVLFVV